MSLMLPGVQVAPQLVGSSGFRTEVGAVVPLALEIYCDRREEVSNQDGHREPVRRSAGAGLIFTGVAVPFEGTCWLGGWVLEVAGIPIYVTEASAAVPSPDRGAWLQVRSSVSVADDYVVDEVEEALQRSVQRLWRVQRIVRFGADQFRKRLAAHTSATGGGGPSHRRRQQLPARSDIGLCLIGRVPTSWPD